MRNSSKWVVLTTALFFGSCSSDDDPIAIDPGVANKLDTLYECLPTLYAKFDALLDVARLWNQKGTNPPNPPGLTSTINGAQLDIRFIIPTTTCQFDFVMKFYTQDGSPVTPDFQNAATLSLQLDNAATDLRNRFPGTKPFGVATWTGSGSDAGSTLTGSGAFTLRIGGTTNQNELEVIRTTTATPSGGEPPNADATINLAGTKTCNLTFNTDPLQTDTVTDQQFPIGTVNFTVTGTNSASGSIEFNNTATATIRITGVNATFSINLNTFVITQTS